MSIKHYSQDIDDQMARLKLIFPDDYAYITVDMEKRSDNVLNYAYLAGASHVGLMSHTTGLIAETPKAAVDSLMKILKITGVEQYIRINHTYRCEECGETYHHPFSVTEISSESTFTILNACDNCQMQVIHEIREQEELMAEQHSEGGAA
jgi:hypothetical protein